MYCTYCNVRGKEDCRIAESRYLLQIQIAFCDKMERNADLVATAWGMELGAPHGGIAIANEGRGHFGGSS